MGSKTPDGYQQAHGEGSRSEPVPQIVKKPEGAKVGLDDDGAGGEDDDGDDDDHSIGSETPKATGMNDNAIKKRKRKKRNKKKAEKPHSPVTQSSPPRVKISLLFPAESYPEGELQVYNDSNLSRITGEELRYLSRQDQMSPAFLSSYREAAEVHRQVRQHARSIIFPGQSLTKIADEIEEGVRALTGHAGKEKGDALKAGMGFPTGLCLNNIAAHWTPNPRGKDVILKKDDVLKVDFGVHVDGRIVDSAFTVAFDPTYDELLESVKEATNTGIKHAGIDARMSEIGAAIQEVMESYEVTIQGKTYPVKTVRNITGHDILRYHIHGNKQVPFIKNKSRQKMEEGEVFAIETFGSTGRAILGDEPGIYGYGRNEHVSGSNLHLSSARSLLKTIDENFGTLVFSRRYLEHLGVTNYLLGMNNLVSQGIVEAYQPLVDIKGSYVAQFEHTILLRSDAKEVISRGDDY